MFDLDLWLAAAEAMTGNHCFWDVRMCTVARYHKGLAFNIYGNKGPFTLAQDCKFGQFCLGRSVA